MSSVSSRFNPIKLLPTDTVEQYRLKLARITLDSMIQFVGLLDAEGTVLEINAVALEAVGIKLADVEGRPFWTTFWWALPTEQELLRHSIARAAAGELVRWDAEIYGRAGGKETIIIDASLCPVMDEDGTVVFICAEGRDITEKKAQEREIARKNVELRALDRAKTAFFSNVSHEFRTPLTLMLGPTEDLLAGTHGELTAPQRTQLELIHRNELRMQRLVNALLEFSRIEAGRVQACYEPVELASLTRELASSFESAIEQAGLELTVDCPALDEPVFVDSSMWEQIVLNLLSNAFKFTFEGGIRVSLRATATTVVLQVTDTGVGVPPEELPRLFERFHRIEGSRARTHEGSGIGLALVQELVRLHGGTIEAESRYGEGTSFTIGIPKGSAHLPPERIGAPVAARVVGAGPAAFVEEALRWLPDEPVPAARLPRVEPVAAALPVTKAPLASESERARILVADDNADMRAYLRRILEERWEVETVSDGVTALGATRARRPDLILSDVMMPGLGGFGLLRELRADPATAAIPVILLSARAGEESRVEGLEAGADDYLVKPFSARELVARVEGNIRLARARVSLSQFEQQLVGIVSHDLRNPLNAIQLTATVMQRVGTYDERTTKAIARIESSCNRAIRLVRDLLDFTQARLAGGIPIEPTAMDLHALTRQVLDEVRASFPGRQLQLDTSGDGRGMWDADRIAQVVTNLASNALKYSPPDSVVGVSTYGDDDAVELRVHNTGTPIPADAIGGLFEPMQRASVQDKASGSVGLGLYIVRHIVRAHGGAIEVSSNERDGTTFTVRLGRG